MIKSITTLGLLAFLTLGFGLSPEPYAETTIQAAPPETNLAGPFAVTVSPSPVPEHSMVYVKTEHTAEHFELEVLTVRNGWVEYVSTEQLARPGEWVFVGPPGQYSVKLRAVDSKTGIVSAVGKVTIGNVPPNVPDVPTDPVTPAPVDPKKKVNRVTYVYEKDQNSVPRPVAFGLQRLNTESGRSIVATEFEEDTTDGDGQVPDQYKVALEEARKAGLPALVVQAGTLVIRVIKAPTTEQAVIDAAK